MTTPPDIFLSYNREDQARAKLFAEAFEAQGFKVWWDVGLRTGEAYDEVTETALRTAKAVVVLWSKKSVQSRWVRAEATLADRNKTLVPCMIEPCERPIMFELTQTAELGHWTGATDDKAWLAFLGDLKRFVAKEAAPAVAPTTTPHATPTIQETLKPGQSGSAPSLAVLPFTNRSGLAEDDVFAEGMVEDVIWALSQGVNVRVLGSAATANLSRAAMTDLAALGRQLGVRYLLEGNVRRVGANLRVATQLLEAATGEIVWTAKFDRPLAELAGLQEDLVTEIAGSLDAQVYSLELARVLKKPGDLTAWEAATRSLGAYSKYDLADRDRAIKEARRAVAIAPDYAPGQAMLADALANAYISGSPDDPAEVERIRAIAAHALALAPNDAWVLSFVGHALCFIGFPEEGLRHTGRAVRMAPGSGQLQYVHGTVLCFLNRMEEALSHLSTGERLMAGSHLMWAVKVFQSMAHAELGRWAEAEAAIDEGISLIPTWGWFHDFKARCCLALGRQTEGRRHIQTARQFGFDALQSERWLRRMSARSSMLEAHIAAVRSLYAETEPSA
jgi:TolB-like protein